MDLDTPLAPTAATAELRSKTQGARGTSPSSVLVLDAGAHSAASTPDWGRSLFGWLSTTYEAVVGLATPTAATAQQQQQHQQQPPPAAAHNGAAADPPPFTSLAPPPPQFHLRAGAHRPGARDDASYAKVPEERADADPSVVVRRAVCVRAHHGVLRVLAEDEDHRHYGVPRVRPQGVGRVVGYRPPPLRREGDSLARSDGSVGPPRTARSRCQQRERRPWRLAHTTVDTGRWRRLAPRRRSG